MGVDPFPNAVVRVVEKSRLSKFTYSTPIRPLTRDFSNTDLVAIYVDGVNNTGGAGLSLEISMVL